MLASENVERVCERPIQRDEGYKMKYLESEVAKELGISGAAIKNMRDEQLQRGKDWSMTGSYVSYTESGRSKILAYVGKPDLQKKDAGLSSQIIQIGEVVEMRVTKIFPINFHLVQAVGSDGIPHLVKVQDNRMYVKKMVIPARKALNMFIAVRRPRRKGVM